MLFFFFLREIPEITPLQGRLIIVHVQKTCISLFFNKYLKSLTKLQHLNSFLNAPTFGNLTRKFIGKPERQNIADHLCLTLHLRGMLK